MYRCKLKDKQKCLVHPKTGSTELEVLKWENGWLVGRTEENKMSMLSASHGGV